MLDYFILVIYDPVLPLLVAVLKKWRQDEGTDKVQRDGSRDEDVGRGRSSALGHQAQRTIRTERHPRIARETLSPELPSRL